MCLHCDTYVSSSIDMTHLQETNNPLVFYYFIFYDGSSLK